MPRATAIPYRSFFRTDREMLAQLTDFEDVHHAILSASVWPFVVVLSGAEASALERPLPFTRNRRGRGFTFKLTHHPPLRRVDHARQGIEAIDAMRRTVLQRGRRLDVTARDRALAARMKSARGQIGAAQVGQVPGNRF